MTVLIVEECVAAHLPAETRARMRVVSEPGRRPRRPRAAAPTSVAARMLEEIGDAAPEAVVLVRRPESDAAAAYLCQLARLIGVPVVRLPLRPDAAAWVAGVAAAWVASGQRDLVRRLEVASAVADGAGSLPGVRSARRPAVRLPVLARWARCAWRPCRWCRGGGLPGRCGGCGAAMVA